MSSTSSVHHRVFLNRVRALLSLAGSRISLESLLQRRGIASDLPEGGDDRDLPGTGEKGEKMPQKGIVISAAGQGLGCDAEVVTAMWNDMTDTAARVLHIALEARDDMDVQVHHRLACRCAGVEPVVRKHAGDGRSLRLPTTTYTGATDAEAIEGFDALWTLGRPLTADWIAGFARGSRPSG
jgi:hypothetical protein